VQGRLACANAKLVAYGAVVYRRYQGFRLTPLVLIIAVNCLLFIATIIVPNLVFLLGLSPLLFRNQPWTMGTNLFIHGNPWHLIANMLTFYFFGRYLSRLIGQSKFLIIYFCGGILGNIFFLILAPPLSIGIGASGAVFALGGTLVMMRPKLRVLVFPVPVPLPLWAAVIGGFVIFSFFPGVAWQAHLGGLVFGLVFGYFLRRRERRFF